MNIRSKMYNASNYTTKDSIYRTFKEQPGLYIWWMPSKAAQRMGIPVEGCDREGDFCKVYIGIAKKSIAARLYWHICESNNKRSHPIKKIKSKVISTLRQSLCGLLQISMDKPSKLNRLFDMMRFQVAYMSAHEAERLEDTALSTGEDWFPLNIQGNKNPALRDFAKRGGILSKARKASRDKALLYNNDVPSNMGTNAEWTDWRDLQDDDKTVILEKSEWIDRVRLYGLLNAQRITLFQQRMHPGSNEIEWFMMTHCD